MKYKSKRFLINNTYANEVNKYIELALEEFSKRLEMIIEELKKQTAIEEEKMEIEIKHLSKEDIITILNKAFELPWWNENNALDMVDKLLGFDEVSIYNSENGKVYTLHLNELCRGIEKFINNGGNTNISNYDLFDCDYIIQYSLFGKLSYHITITKHF